MTDISRHPAAEAAALVGGHLTVRVLEPSPPTVVDGPFFADDPASRGEGLDVVTPTSQGDQTWDDLVTQRPELGDFASRHWLGARGALPPLPDNYAAVRDAFHRLAYGVVAEARRVANTKFGLRYTRGGFGTPFFGADEQVRVEADRIVRQRGDQAESQPISTLSAAAAFVGVTPGTDAAEHDSPELGDIDEPLAVSAEGGVFLGEWFGLSWAVLEELRATPDAHDPERIQLWPGHFDPALAIGDADAGGKATYGMSPGDHAHDEPYLYIGAWGSLEDAGIHSGDPFWNETSFSGASLSYRDLIADGSPYETALAFFRRGYDALNSKPSARSAAISRGRRECWRSTSRRLFPHSR